MGTMLDAPSAGFTENRGQVADAEGRPRPEILYTADLGSARLFFTRRGVSTVFTRVSPKGSVSEATGRADAVPAEGSEASIAEVFRVDMQLVGADAGAVVAGEHALASYSNYYLPQCPSGVTGVKSYRTLVYRNVYDRIDLVYRAASYGKLKYEFIVRPGGDPSAIRMRYHGSPLLSLARDGGLHVGTPLGSLEESRPYVYQDAAAVPGCAFTVDGNEAGFEIGAYDRSRTLVIDPWGIYLGGAAWEYNYSPTNTRNGGANQDPSGNILVCAFTQGANFPVSNGYQQIYGGGGFDGFVSKLDASGGILWSTFFGGSDFDDCMDVACDGSDNVFVTGITSSANFPLLNAYQTTQSGDDAFVAKFNASGALQWSSLYGGSGTDQGWSIRLNGSGDIIVVGGSQGGLPIVGGYQSTHGGQEDGFLMKLSSTGVPQWSTFFGGSGDDRCTSFELDGSGNIYVCGSTSSANLPLMLAAQSTYGGARDQFIAKWTTSGSPLWATYWGGSGMDLADDICLAPSGDLYIIGQGAGNAYPLLNQVQAFAGDTDVTIAEFSNSGTCLWSTYFGGNRGETGIGIGADASGNIYITGRTRGGTYPLLNAYQTSMAGQGDILIAKFTSGHVLEWSTVFGGNGGESGVSVLVNSSDIIIVGGSNSTDWGTLHNFPPKPGSNDVVVFSLTTSGNYPVDLASLSAAFAGGRVLVGWSTESESGNHGFEVQRSFDPADDAWETRGFVTGSGTTTARHAYAFSDELPSGLDPAQVVFYRLKQIDTDGTTRYSHVVEVFRGGSPHGLSIASVFPQPASEIAGVRIASPPGEAVTIHLVDALGRSRWTTTIPGGIERVLEIPVASLPPGLYEIVAASAGSTAVEKLLLRSGR